MNGVVQTPTCALRRCRTPAHDVPTIARANPCLRQRDRTAGSEQTATRQHRHWNTNRGCRQADTRPNLSTSPPSTRRHPSRRSRAPRATPKTASSDEAQSNRNNLPHPGGLPHRGDQPHEPLAPSAMDTKPAASRYQPTRESTPRRSTSRRDRGREYRFALTHGANAQEPMSNQ